jgi:hypothetical protein
MEEMAPELFESDGFLGRGKCSTRGVGCAIFVPPPRNSVTHPEHRASSMLSKHEGESSLALCDRVDRTRVNSQRQLSTGHDYAVPTREYRIRHILQYRKGSTWTL